jgi:hypothetical protein
VLLAKVGVEIVIVRVWYRLCVGAWRRIFGVDMILSFTPQKLATESLKSSSRGKIFFVSGL